MRPSPRSPASLASAASVVSAALALLASAGVFAVAAGTTACTQLADDLLGIDGGSGDVASDAATATGVSYPDGGELTSEIGTGTNCGTEVTTGVVLCTGVTSCPSITVDQTALTGCGFRINGGDSYDLECGCNGYLCPLGTPTTCDEATTLLSNQTVALVCEEVSEGHCTQPGGTTTTTTTTTSTCDESCAANCVNAPTCLELCGC
jgi:hypothetical protein